MTKSTHIRGDSDSSAGKRKCSPCQQEDDDDDASSYSRNGVNSWDTLPEDVVHHIHALMPMRDAARAACVSRSFLHSWRYYPNLTLSVKELGLIGHEHLGTEEERTLELLSIVDGILPNHSGIGVKTLKLQLPWNWKKLDTCHVDRFLKTAIAPGIQELTVTVPSHFQCKLWYNFPCSLLAGESGESYLTLTNSSFRPTAGLGCLTRLHLQSVHIGDNEFGCFLPSSLALRHMQLPYCGGIICLKIPCLLQNLRSLKVFMCKMLQSIESKAPNVSTVDLLDNHLMDVSLSLGDGSSQVKKLRISSVFASYGLRKLPSIATGLEALDILLLPREPVSTPILVPGKFHHLKYLNVSLDIYSEAYDYLSLLAFLDASPALETFILWSARTKRPAMPANKSSSRIHGDLSHLTRMPEFCHGSLKDVMIHSFCSAESLIELTRRILQHVASLERITLDTTHGYTRCSCRSDRSFGMEASAVREAQEALVAIRKYIKPQVPCNVELTVVELCNSCHLCDDGF